MASYVMTVATLAYIHRLFTEVKLQPATAGAEETEEQSEAVAETEDTSSWAEGDGKSEQVGLRLQMADQELWVIVHNPWSLGYTC